MYLSKDRLVKTSCGLESFGKYLEVSQNLIVTLRLYIQGHVTLKKPSPTPVKAPKKTSKVQSRPTKNKTTKMLDSDSSNSTEDDETKVTSGAKLASGVLSSEQNKIRRDLM